MRHQFVFMLIQLANWVLVKQRAAVALSWQQQVFSVRVQQHLKMVVKPELITQANTSLTGHITWANLASRIQSFTLLLVTPLKWSSWILRLRRLTKLLQFMTLVAQ